MDYLQSSLERVEFFQNICLDRATGGLPDESEYSKLRQVLLADSSLVEYLPSWVRTCRSLSQFWQYIKKIDGYQPRRNFIWTEFNSILSILEASNKNPAADLIAKRLTTINSQYVQDHWSKALDRKSKDPEGAITLARTLLESCCKHILDTKCVEYNPAKLELSELYKMASKELNMAPEQQDRKSVV